MNKDVVFMVEITEGRGWYADSEGEIFDCFLWGGSFLVREDYYMGADAAWRHVRQEDCKIVSALGVAHHDLSQAEYKAAIKDDEAHAAIWQQLRHITTRVSKAIEGLDEEHGRINDLEERLRGLVEELGNE